MLTRRYYGNHKLAEVTARDIAGAAFVTAEDAGPGQVTLIAAAAADIAALPAAIAALGTLAAQVTANSLVADLYVTWAGHPEPDALALRLGELLAASPLSSSVLARPGRAGDLHGGRRQRHRHAAPLHVPSGRTAARRAWSRTG